MIYDSQRIEKLAKTIQIYEQKCDDALFFLFSPETIINRKINFDYLDRFNSLTLAINDIYQEEVLEFHYHPMMTLEYHFDGPKMIDVTFVIHDLLREDLRKILMR